MKRISRVRLVPTLVSGLVLAASVGVLAPQLDLALMQSADGTAAAVRSSLSPLSPLSGRRVATGWIPWWRLADGVASVLAHPDLFAEVSPFWYRATRASTVVDQESGQPPESELIAAVDSLHAAGVRVLPTVNDVGLNSSSMARLLGDGKRRGDLVRSLVAMVDRIGADGVDIDFEAMNFPASPDRAVVSRKFPVFLRSLQTSLHRDGQLLSVSVPSRTSGRDPNWSIYHYGALAPYVDRVRVLTYDYSYAGGDPGPIAPIDWVESVTRYAESKFPRVPLSIGLPAYGYNWYIKKLLGSCPRVIDVGATTAPTTRQALVLIDDFQATLQWHRGFAESMFTYRRPYPDGGNDCVVRRQVWFEAARSVAAKLALLRRHNVQGFSFWTLGAEDPRTWRVLDRYATRLEPKSAAADLEAPRAIRAGAKATIVGRFRVGGRGVASADISVQRRVGRGDWSTVATVTTTSLGRAAYLAAPNRTSEWRMRLPASWDWGNTISPTALVRVRRS